MHSRSRPTHAQELVACQTAGQPGARRSRARDSAGVQLGRARTARPRSSSPARTAPRGDAAAGRARAAASPPPSPPPAAAHVRSAARRRRSVRRALAQGKAGSACLPYAQTSTTAILCAEGAVRARVGRAQGVMRARHALAPAAVLGAPPARRGRLVRRVAPRRRIGGRRPARQAARRAAAAVGLPARPHRAARTHSWLPASLLCRCLPCAAPELTAGASKSAGKVGGHGSESACGNRARV